MRGERLLRRVYENGRFIYDTNDLKAIDDARAQVLKTLQRAEFPTQESEKTRQLHLQVREKLLGQLLAFEKS